jgi:class 3 adenylate cyclase
VSSANLPQEAQTRHVKYVFVDVVGFSSRHVEAQADIVAALNRAVTSGVEAILSGGEVIFIPTGDGICVAVLDGARYDAHLQLGIHIHQRIAEFNENQKDTVRRFRVRVGLCESVDSIVQDINGNRNVAGAGVTLAQRVMDAADGGQILVSESVYHTLKNHEKYVSAFSAFKIVVKHDVELQMFQFIGPLEMLNVDTPTAFKNAPHRIDSRLRVCLRANPSSSGECECFVKAAREWDDEVRGLFKQLGEKSSEETVRRAMEAFDAVRKKEEELDAVFSSLKGAMSETDRAKRRMEVLRRQALELQGRINLIQDPLTASRDEGEIGGGPSEPAVGASDAVGAPTPNT